MLERKRREREKANEQNGMHYSIRGGKAVWWGLFRVWFPPHFIYSPRKKVFIFNSRSKRKKKINGKEERERKDSKFLSIYGFGY